MHKPSWQALNKKLSIWTWEKNDPNHPGKRFHPPSLLRQCPFTRTVFKKRGFPKTVICLLKTKSWKGGTCLKLLDWFWSISFTFQDAARADECAIRSRRTGKWQEVRSKKLRSLSCLGHEFEVDVRWGRAQNPPLLNYVSINFLSRGLTISPGRLIRTSHHLGRRHVTNIQRDANRSTTFSLAGRPCLDHIGQCYSDTFHLQNNIRKRSLRKLWSAFVGVKLVKIGIKGRAMRPEIFGKYSRKFLIAQYVSLAEEGDIWRVTDWVKFYADGGQIIACGSICGLALR